MFRLSTSSNESSRMVSESTTDSKNGSDTTAAAVTANTAKLSTNFRENILFNFVRGDFFW